MTYIYDCLGLVAPYYNMVLVVILVALFIALFRRADKKVFIKPWKLLFFAICVYILEEITTILASAGIIVLPDIVNAVLETVIVTSFIYMVLIQKEYVKNETLFKKYKK